MLKRAGSTLSQQPMRYIGGASLSGLRSFWGRGDRFNQSIGGGITSKLSAVPSGHLAPSAWILPYKAGAMSSRNEALIVFVGSANGAQGLNAVGSTSITFTGSANGQAVASAVGSATITFTASGNATAPLNAVGSSTITFTSSGVATAIADMSGLSTITFTASGNTYAIGNMIAVPISTELTADQIAIAVINQAMSSPIYSNVKYVNDIEVKGTGTDVDPWNPV